ncbi:MAG: CaiB/BaiF CoA-transferase family protein [Gemmatimonadetes bacterium]|nr:CaiB/BaiF CoA-transferase family protein [Gemmatimonadota bacterium]
MSLAHSLDGVRVLDLSRLLPGPFLTMVLADLGADVVKVEEPRAGDYMRDFPPRGEGMSGRYLTVNRNKRSVKMDLKDDQERERFLQMATRADVVVESFRPGVMERLGVGYEALRGRNAGIILCSISGYGQTGPYRDRAGHDINYLALAGVLAMSGTAPDGPPGMAGVQIADMAGGAMWGALGILAALIQRDRTGAGTHLDISMTEGALALLASEFGILDAEPEVPTRGTGLLNGGAARYGVYRTSDGKYLSVGALEPQFLSRLAAAAKLELPRGPETGAADAGVPGEDEFRRQLTRVIASKTRAEWVRVLAEYDCCCEPVLELDEVTEHPLHRQRELFFEIGDSGLPGSLQVRTPLGMPAARRPAPALGQHNDEVFREYGVRAIQTSSDQSGR